MILRFPRYFPCVVAGISIFFCGVAPPFRAQAQSPGELIPAQSQTVTEQPGTGKEGIGQLGTGQKGTGQQLRFGRVAELDLPDAPEPQQAQAASSADSPSSSSSSSSTAQAPADASSASAPASGDPKTGGSKPVEQPKSQHDIAEEQLKQEKKQRVLGFLPSFNTTYVNSAVSLTWKQKFNLALAQTTDPVQFFIAGVAGGISEAEGSDKGYGGGPIGYGKRVGADYLDSFDGNMIGNWLLPSILHQDPRFFRRGYGSKTYRAFYAVSTSFICKHDVTGKWEPNYSNVLGNVAGGAISNYYVPKDERGWDNVFEGAALVTIEGGIGSILQEFWPDISRKYFHFDPTHGQDAVNAATRR